jgi:ADP-ribose pyrophosphatase
MSEFPAVEEWVVLAETTLTGPSGYMKLLTRQYALPDGRTSDWDLLDGGRTVAVLAITPDSQVVLARQFRPGPGRTLNEMPGGFVDPGEQVMAAAGRELLEETGYEAGSLEMVGHTWLCAAATTQRFVVIARDCRPIDQPRPVGDEFCVPIMVSLPDFRQALRSGAMTDVDLGYLALDQLGLL